MSLSEPLGHPVRRRWALPAVLVLTFGAVLSLVVLHDSVRYYQVTSGSMQPTLSVGSRVAIRPGATLRRREIVVFDAPAGAVGTTPVCGVSGEGQGFCRPCGLGTVALQTACTPVR